MVSSTAICWTPTPKCKQLMNDLYIRSFGNCNLEHVFVSMHARMKKKVSKRKYYIWLSDLSFYNIMWT